MYVLYRYKTKQICNKVILENSRMFWIIPDCTRIKKIENYKHSFTLAHNTLDLNIMSLDDDNLEADSPNLKLIST